MSKAKSPKEKKQLSLERDRRNTYGENAKSSRKNIPKSKRLSHKSERRAGNGSLAIVKGTVSEDAATQAEMKSRERLIEKKLNGFVKKPDKPLKVVLERKRARKSALIKSAAN